MFEVKANVQDCTMLTIAIYHRKGDMYEAFTVLAIQKRQFNLPLDRDDKCYKVTIDKRV